MRGELRWAATLVVLGAAARLAAARWLGGSLHFIDEAGYVDTARRLLAGGGFGADYANVPAYPVVLALLAAPWPDDVGMLRAAQAIVTAGGVVLVLRLGERLLGAGAAHVAGTLYALDPLVVVTGALFYPEAIAGVVLLGALLAAWSAAHEDRVSRSATAGLLLGLLAQLRPVALVLVPFVTLWTGAFAPRRRGSHVLGVVAACTLTLAPWTVRNYRVHGGFVPLSRAGTQGVLAPHADAEAHGLTASIALRLWQDPAGSVQRMGRELGHFWELYPTRLWTDNAERRAMLHREDERLPVEPTFPAHLRDRVSALTFGAELLLALLGLGLAWDRHRAAALLLAGVPVAYGVGYALFIAKLRYRAAVLPCVFLLAGLGAMAVWRAAGGRRAP